MAGRREAVAKAAVLEAFGSQSKYRYRVYIGFFGVYIGFI